MTPHVADEMWERLDKSGSTYRHEWPVFDPEAVLEDEITIVVQVNGKVRDRLTVPFGTSEAEVERQALACDKVVRELEGGKSLRKVISVAGKLINFVIA